MYIQLVAQCLYRDVERPIPVQPPSSDRSSSLATPQSPPNDDDVDDEYDDYEEENSHPSSESGLSVEQRRRQASKDIAAAKARQAAFVSQGRSQFTDTDAAQPKVPDFSDDSDASATATTILDKTQTPRSERYSPDSGPRRPDASSATDTFALDDPTPRPDSSASSSRQRQQSSSEPDSFKPTYAQVQLSPCCCTCHVTSHCKTKIL